MDSPWEYKHKTPNFARGIRRIQERISAHTSMAVQTALPALGITFAAPCASQSVALGNAPRHPYLWIGCLVSVLECVEQEPIPGAGVKELADESPCRKTFAGHLDMPLGPLLISFRSTSKND